jgi:hypothetical protein
VEETRRESELLDRCRWRSWKQGFVGSFETFSAYGAAIDKLNADPAFQAWQVKRAKAGLASFVRSNLAVEITV